MRYFVLLLLASIDAIAGFSGRPMIRGIVESFDRTTIHLVSPEGKRFTLPRKSIPETMEIRVSAPLVINGQVEKSPKF